LDRRRCRWLVDGTDRGGGRETTTEDSQSDNEPSDGHTGRTTGSMNNPPAVDDDYDRRL